MLDLQVFSLLSLHSWTTAPIFCHEEQREDSHNQRTSLPSQGRVGMSVLQMEEEKTTLQFRKKLNLLWILPWVQTATHVFCSTFCFSDKKRQSSEMTVKVSLLSQGMCILLTASLGCRQHSDSTPALDWVLYPYPLPTLFMLLVCTQTQLLPGCPGSLEISLPHISQHSWKGVLLQKDSCSLATDLSELLGF